MEGGQSSRFSVVGIEIFGGRPSWKATGLQLQSGSSRFFEAGLEGDRATTATWELEIFGGRPVSSLTFCFTVSPSLGLLWANLLVFTMWSGGASLHRVEEHLSGL